MTELVACDCHVDCGKILFERNAVLFSFCTATQKPIDLIAQTVAAIHGKKTIELNPLSNQSIKLIML